MLKVLLADCALESIEKMVQRLLEMRVFQLRGGNQKLQMTRTSAVTGAVENSKWKAHN